MARTKVRIAVDELQDAINQLEASRLFTSPHKLYEAVAQTPWARALGATPVMVYLRVKEVNVDPDHPVITMRVKPARKVGPRETVAGDQGESRPAKTRRVKVAGATFDGIHLLMDAFRNRGIEVTVVEQLITDSRNSYDENRMIILAWADLRDKLRIPKPAKKAASLVNDEEVPITASPTVVESIIEEPIAESVDPVITVTEEMPDGCPVPMQTEVEVEPSGEPEIVLDVTTVEPAVPSAQPSSPMPVAPAVASVPVAVPSPIQVTPVRPVMSRPVPVRSVVPPRPMPVASA
jgi:hypothetical protein